MATGSNGQGLRLGGGQGLVIDGMRAGDASVIAGNDAYLPDLHTLDSNPYAQLVANGEGELLTGQDYWNQARNRADSALTARYQDYYTKEAAQINAQRQADAAQATTARNQLSSNLTTSLVEQDVQARNGGTAALPGSNTAAGFIEGSGGAATGYLRAGRRADPTAIGRLDTRISKAVSDLEDYAVDSRNPALYVAAGYLPRSSGEIVLGATLGPAAGRVLGAGVRALNAAATGTFLATDLGAVAGRALNEVVEFGAERLGRLNEGLGLQPALIENTGARFTDSVTFRGGAYGRLQGGAGIERHHLPADSVSSITTYSGPAIQMEKADHLLTSSHGSQGLAGAQYRAEIGQMMEQGQMRSAMAREILDVRRAAVEGGGNVTKYNSAVQEMLDYSYGKGWLAK